MSEKEIKYISLQEAAKLCEYSQEYLSLRARAQKLRAIKIGRNWATTKEWLSQYCSRTEEFKNELKNGKAKQVLPPENLPVEIDAITLRKMVVFEMATRAAVAALSFLIVFSGIAFGKEFSQGFDFGVRNAAIAVSSGVQEFGKGFDVGVPVFSKQIAKGAKDFVQEFSQGFDYGLNSPAAVADFAKNTPSNLVGGYSKLNALIELGLQNDAHGIAKIYSNANNAVEQGLRSDTFALAQGAERISTSAANFTKTTAAAVSKTIAEQIEKTKQLAVRLGNAISNPFIKSFEFAVRPWSPQPVLAPQKEIVKQEPTREIVREYVSVDNAQLADLRSQMAGVLAMSGDIQTLKQITAKFQNAPPSNSAANAPLYIGSTGIQVAGNAQFASVGAPSGGFTNLGVGGSANIGNPNDASSKFTVASTSTFTGPVTINSSFGIGTSALTAFTVDTSGNLSTTGTIKVKDSNGNAKITLDTNGNITAGGLLTATGGLAVSGSSVTFSSLNVTGTTVLGGGSADTMEFRASTLTIPNNLNIASKTLYIDSQNSRVGIGTSSPQTKLHVALADSATSAISDVFTIDHTSTGTPAAGFGSAILFRLANAGGVINNAARIASSLVTATSGSEDSVLAFYTGASGAAPTEKLRIDQSGNIGIGTTSPGRLVDISGPASTSLTGARVITTGSTGYGAYYTLNSNSITNGHAFIITSAGDLDTFASQQVGAGNFVISDAAVGSGSNNNPARLVINASGNVGIGTTTPSQKLEVNGNLAFTSAATISTLAGNLILNPGGNVGIGTGTPVSTKFVVAANDAVTNAVTDVIAVDHTSTGTAAANFGAGLLFRLQNGSGTLNSAAEIAASLTTATSGSEDSFLSFSTQASGAAPSEKWRITSGGNFQASQASDIVAVANTANAFRVTDATTALLAIDTRTSVTSSSIDSIMLQPKNITIGAGATARAGVTIGAGTYSINGGTTITSLFDIFRVPSHIFASNSGSPVVSSATAISASPPTPNTSVTITDDSSYRAVNPASFSGTITNQYGLYVESLTRGTTANYGIYVNTPSGAASNYALFVAGGTSSFGGAVSASSTLSVTGTVTASSDLMVVGNTSLSGSLTVAGITSTNGNVVLGSTAANTITFTGVVNSDIVSDATSTRNFGSASKTWANGYFDTVNATNLSGTVITGSTSSATWTINSANATNNAQISNVAFKTGTAAFNAVEQWNAAGDAARFAGYDNNFVFNYPISIISQVSGPNQTFTSGNLFNYSQSATHAITQSGAFKGLNVNFSSNITVPNSSSGNQTGVLVTLKDGGASATSVGYQTAGTLDYGLDVGGTIGTADIRLSNSATLTNTSTALTLATTTGNQNIAFTPNGIGSLQLTSGTTTGTGTTAGLSIAANSLTSGTGLDITSTSTAGTASGASTLLNLSRSGANSNLAHTAYGLYSTVTNTNATSGTNIAAYLSASGATTANYGLIVAAGRVGIDNTSPAVALDVTGAGTFSSTLTASSNFTMSAGALNITATSGAISATGLGASTIGTTSANLTLSTTTSGTLAVTSAGALNLTGAAASTWTVTSGGLTINSTSANLALQTTTSGNITIVPASTGSVQLTSGTTTGTGTTAGLSVAANSLTSGTGLDVTSTSTAGTGSGSSALLNLSRSGANSNLAHTAYGLYSTVTNTNATSGTNIAAYLSASGATTANYGLIVAAGSVGIGTATPSAPLDVRGTAAADGANQIVINAIDTTAFAQGVGGGIAFAGKIDAVPNLQGFAGIKGIKENATSGNKSGALVFNTSNSSGTLTEAMRIDSSQRVGIGTTSPGSALDILAPAASTGFNLAGTAPASSSGNGTNAATNTLAVVGTAGGASSGVTGQTGGTGGALSLTAGVGGAVAGASGIGGVGGAISFTSGAGGAGAATGGAGGALTLTSGNAGTGGNANAGTLTLTTGSVTGTGTATINLGTTNATAINIGRNGSALTLASNGTSAWTNTSGNLTISTATSGTLALTSAGALNETNGAASTYSSVSNTATSYKITDGTNAYLTLNTQTTTSGVSALTFATGTAPTIASAATAYFNSSTFTPGTVNFSGSTQITSTGTSANNAILFNQPTINRTDAATSLIIDQASNLFINGPTIASHATVGQTETITASAALRIGAGSSVAGTRGVVTNAYGLYVDAPTGATNNYAATFATGNVGIGTTSPGSKLDVNGNLNVTSGASNSTFSFSTGTLSITSSGAQGVASPVLKVAMGSATAGNNGVIGIPNNQFVTARNAANADNIPIIGLDSNNKVSIGTGASLTNASGVVLEGPVTVSSDGVLTVSNTTDSTSGSSGSINTAGGLGVKKSLVVEGNASAFGSAANAAVANTILNVETNAFDIGTSGGIGIRTRFTAHSTSNNTAVMRGIYAFPTLSNSNTANWTGTIGIAAVDSVIQVSNGSGSVTGIANFHAITFTSGGTITVTNQYGLYVDALSGATNNYGLYINTPTGTIADAIHTTGGRAYFGGAALFDASGTALTVTNNAVISGTAAVGTTIATNKALRSFLSQTDPSNTTFGLEAIGKGSATISNGNIIIGAYGEPDIAVGNSLNAHWNASPVGLAGLYALTANLNSASNAYTVTGVAGLYIQNQANKGSATITNQYGAYIEAMTGATNNYGLYINTPTGTIAEAIHTTGGLVNLGGNLQFANASSIIFPANTASALQLTDGTNYMMKFDSRTTTDQITPIILTAANPTFASATGSSYSKISIPNTDITLTGTTTPVTAMNGILVNTGQGHISSDANAKVVTQASAFYIGGAPNGNSGSITITNGYGLFIAGSAIGKTTNGYGLSVAAPTGATTNYAAVFTGGNVGIGTTSPTSLLHVVGSQPSSVGTTPGTAATAVETITGGTGGNTSIATTGVGGVGALLSITGGTGGTADSATTADTGGAGGAITLTTGTGGAAAATAGTKIGGAGGTFTIAGGVGGAASGVGTNTGGAGGAISITAGAAGSGGNANGGTLTLNSGAVTGTGTSTINIGTASSTAIVIGNATSNPTLSLAGTGAVTVAGATTFSATGTALTVTNNAVISGTVAVGTTIDANTALTTLISKVDPSSTVTGVLGAARGSATASNGNFVVGVQASPQIASGNTAGANWTSSPVGIAGLYSLTANLNNTANAYTVTGVAGLYVQNQANKGSATITNQYGAYIEALTGATNNYGIYINTPTGTIADAIHTTGGRAYFGGAALFDASGTALTVTNGIGASYLNLGSPTTPTTTAGVLVNQGNAFAMVDAIRTGGANGGNFRIASYASAPTTYPNENASGLIAQKARGNLAVPSVVSANDVIAMMEGQSYTSNTTTGFGQAGAVVIAASEAGSAGGGSYIGFWTRANGSSTATQPSERVRIDNAGNLQFSQATTISTTAGNLTINPSGDLQINGNNSTSKLLYNDNAGNTIMALRPNETFWGGAGEISLGRNSNPRSFVSIDQPAITSGNAFGDNVARFRVSSNSAWTMSSGAATTASTAMFDQVNVAGTTAPTNTATVYITGASSAGTNNYGLWVASGTSRFGGTIDLQGGTLQNSIGALTINPSGNTVFSTGNVGIGTGTPVSSKLTVVANDAVTNAVTDVLAIDHTSTGTAAANFGAGMLFRLQNASGVLNNAAEIAASLTTATSGSEDSFLTFSTQAAGAAPAERVRIDKSGNVGIGTTAPQDVLDLGTATAGNGIAWGGLAGAGRYNNFFSSYSNAGLVLAAGFKGSTAADSYLSTFGSAISRAGIRLNPFGGNAGTIQFFTDAASTNAIGAAVTPTERMRIDNAGNVGIGTTGPLAKLHIANTADSSLEGLWLDSGSTGAQNAIMRFLDRGTQVFALYKDSGAKGAATLRVYSNSMSTDVFTIKDSNGYVGIGTTAPGVLLDVNKSLAGSSYGNYPAVTVTNPNTSGDAYSALVLRSGTTDPGSGIAGHIGLVSTYAASNSGWYMQVKTAKSNYPLYLGANANDITITGSHVGIETTTPNSILSVVGAATDSASNVFAVTNTDTTDQTSNNAMRVNIGTVTTGTLARFVIFYAGSTTDNNGTAVGHINLNNNAVNYATSGADFAEQLPVADAVEPGDIIGVNATGNVKATANIALVGVVSDSAGFTGNSKETPDPNAKLATIGFLGQIKTKVSTENGPIAVGDSIAASSVAGVGAKSTKPGDIIGTALEAYSQSGVSRILVLVRPHWQGNDLSVTTTSSGTISNIDPAQLKAGLADLGLVVNTKGILEVDTLKARKVAVQRIELADQKNGDIYCTWIQAGEWVKVRSTCDTIQIDGSTANAPSSPAVTFSTAAPTATTASTITSTTSTTTPTDSTTTTTPTTTTTTTAPTPTPTATTTTTTNSTITSTTDTTSPTTSTSILPSTTSSVSPTSP